MGGSVYRRMIRYVTVLHADGSSEYGRDGRERPSMHDPGSIGSEIWRPDQAMWICAMVNDSVMHGGATGIVGCPPGNRHGFGS
jgi:hypothetical protein